MPEISTKDLTETIVHLTGFTEQIVCDICKPNGQPWRKLDISRPKECLDLRRS